MVIFTEILSLLWSGFWATLCGIGDAVYALLPSVMQLNKLASYFTPTGMVAFYFGVPTVFVTIVFGIVKKAIKKANN